MYGNDRHEQEDAQSNHAKYDGNRDMMQKRAASDSNDLPRRGCWET